MQTWYEVIVGNIGKVYEGKSHSKAMATFEYYVDYSKSGKGRPGGENVTVLLNGEPVEEYYAPEPF